MHTNIKTSKANKEVVTRLTSKLNLGTENMIARLPLCHSLALDRKLSLTEIADSGGKEYSPRVLFGDNADHYLAMICVHYNLYKSDKDLPKYVKMHIDDGLQLLNGDLNNSLGFDSIMKYIEKGLHGIF